MLIKLCRSYVMCRAPSAARPSWSVATAMPISSSAARRALKFLGRFIRDSTLKIAGDAALAERVIPLLDRCVGRKCRTIASATTKIPACAGGQVHRQGQDQSTPRVRLQGERGDAGDPAVRAACQSAVRQSFDGHTLGPVFAEMTRLLGVEPRPSTSTRAIAAITISTSFGSGSAARRAGSPRPSGATRAAITPAIGQINADDRMHRNYLRRREDDRTNALQLQPVSALAGVARALIAALSQPTALAGLA